MPLILDDSHLMVVDHLSRCNLTIKRILHFDAHSDLSLLKKGGNDGNVLTWWLTHNEVDEIFWVVPAQLLEHIQSSGVAVIYSYVPTAVPDSLKTSQILGIASLQLLSNTKLTIIQANDLAHIPATSTLWLDFDLDFLSLEPNPKQWLLTHQTEIKRLADQAQAITFALSFNFGTTCLQDLTWAIPLWRTLNRDSAYVPSLAHTFTLQEESQHCIRLLTQQLVNDLDRQLRELFYRGELDKFIEKVQTAVQANYPLQKDTTYLLPMAYFLTGQYSEAIQYFDQEYTEYNDIYAQYAKNILQKVQTKLIQPD